MKFTHALIVGLVCGVISTPAYSALTRGPYIQIGTPTTMTIVWRTDSPIRGKVHYGLSAKVLTETVSGLDGQTQHEVLVTGLTPSTRYYYGVEDTDGTILSGDSYFFETAPAVGSKKPSRMWIVGDSGTGDNNQAMVRDSMLEWTASYRPDIYLHMGDMAYDSGKDDEFQENFFDVYNTILRNTVCWATLGNHEGYTASSANQSGPYYDAYVLPTSGQAGGLASGTEAYYSFDYANIHFVVLDSDQSDRTPNGPMLTWMTSDLAATTQDWIIAYWHHPPYSKGSHDSDTESKLTDMRENALPILEAAGVDLVLGGHSHIYERSYLVNGAYDTPTTAAGHILDPSKGDPNDGGPYKKATGANQGSVYIVAGHGGRGMYQKGTHPLMAVTERKFGSCIVDVEGNTLTLHNVRADGVVSDSMALIKGNGILLTAPDGGESYMANETAEIAWASVGITGTVQLLFSADNGQNWTAIASDVANNGSFEWTVPYTVTDQGRIRIENSDGSVYDTSNSSFSLNIPKQYKAIPYGSSWRYHDQNKDPGPSWFNSSYDDTSWAQGDAQFGYGDDDETTEILNEVPNIPSVYFRHELTLEHAVDTAQLTVLHDDGAAVWINGTLVLKKYMDDGLAFATFASQTSQDNTLTPVDLKTEHYLVEGKNVIAVMIKQTSETSSDVSFDLELEVMPILPPPPPEPEPTPEPQPEQEPSADTNPTPESDNGPQGKPDAATPPPVKPSKSGGCKTTGNHTTWPILFLMLCMVGRMVYRPNGTDSQ